MSYNYTANMSNQTTNQPQEPIYGELDPLFEDPLLSEEAITDLVQSLPDMDLEDAATWTRISDELTSSLNQTGSQGSSTSTSTSSSTSDTPQEIDVIDLTDDDTPPNKSKSKQTQVSRGPPRPRAWAPTTMPTPGQPRRRSSTSHSTSRPWAPYNRTREAQPTSSSSSSSSRRGSTTSSTTQREEVLKMKLRLAHREIDDLDDAVWTDRKRLEGAIEKIQSLREGRKQDGKALAAAMERIRQLEGLR